MWTSTKPKIKKSLWLFCELAVSALLICLISQLIYNKTNLDRLYKLLECGDGNECQRLNKMRKFWPPPTHPLIYLIFAGSCHFLHSNLISTFQTTKNQFFGIVVAGIVSSIWILLPERIGEMDIIVLSINFIHVILTLCITFINFSLFNQKLKMLRLVFQSSDALTPYICFTNQLRFRRRTLTPPPWIPPKERSVAKFLTADQRKEFEESGEFDNLFLSDRINPVKFATPKPIPESSTGWTENSKRFGLVGRKIGMTPLWTKDGTRILCTIIEVPENHVISAIDPDTWYKTSLVGKRKAFGRFGPMWRVTVGAFDTSPTFLSPQYRHLFESVNVPYKDKIVSFMATDDALVKPGTALDVRHFQVGQFVAVTGKTIDWGFQGAMHRWGFRGMPAKNTTKSHRRVGSVGSTGDARIWPGKRMPGHMGYEWRTDNGVEILRINPLKQIIYVKGCVPGDCGEMVLIKDYYSGKKMVKDPPFPTYVLNEDDVRPNYGDVSIADITKYDIYAENMFQFSSPSIVFTEKDETKSPARDTSRAKIAKVKK